MRRLGLVIIQPGARQPGISFPSCIPTTAHTMSAFAARLSECSAAVVTASARDLADPTCSVTAVSVNHGASNTADANNDPAAGEVMKHSRY